MTSLLFRFHPAMAAALLWGSTTAHADGMQALEHFLRNVPSAQGQFTQVVISPPRAGESAGRRKTASGTFALARPNKFRFEYHKPFEQWMVSDGQTLSVYDFDLQQLTQRKLSEVMPGTPAVLLTGASLRELERVFEIRSQTDRDGLQWVLAKPRAKDTTLTEILIGFEPGEQGKIAALQVADSFGQITRMNLGQVSYGPVPSQQFVFKLPKSGP